MTDEFSEEDWKMKSPSTIMVGGPTMSGKSTLIKKLVTYAQEMFDPPPEAILYCYGEDDDAAVAAFEKLGAHTHFGVPTDEELNKYPKPLMVILDDLMTDVKNDYLTSLYTKKAHHKNLIVVFVTQYWFEKRCKAARDNSQYLFITKAPNAEGQVFELGKQLFRGNLDLFKYAYRHATEEIDEDQEYGYLFIANHPAGRKKLRLRTKIYPDEERIVYTN